MRHAMSILMGVVMMSTFCVVAGYPEQGKEPAGGAETGAVVGAPSEMRLKIVQDGFLLTWTLSPQDPGVVAGYEIVRANVFSGPYETVGKVDKGISSFVDRTAKPEAIYFYKVRALPISLRSPFSREAAGEIPGKP